MNAVLRVITPQGLESAAGIGRAWIQQHQAGAGAQDAVPPDGRRANLGGQLFVFGRRLLGDLARRLEAKEPGVLLIAGQQQLACDRDRGRHDVTVRRLDGESPQPPTGSHVPPSGGLRVVPDNLLHTAEGAVQERSVVEPIPGAGPEEPSGVCFQGRHRFAASARMDD